MKTVKLKNWNSFKGMVVDAFHQVSPDERSLFWFRGQGNYDWPLACTLDRFHVFPSDDERNTCYTNLLAAFRQEMIGLSAFKDLQGEPLELLARHHGLPSPLLDWTESPYIAAFFAFFDSLLSRFSGTAVYALNRSRLPDTRHINLIQDRELIRYNERALEQKGVFLRINSIERPTEELMGEALVKFRLPRAEMVKALNDLASMGITVRNLFRDLDGAANAARARIRLNLGV